MISLYVKLVRNSKLNFKFYVNIQTQDLHIGAIRLI